MEQINIGIIGAGYIGREHARSLRLVANMFGDKVRLVAVSDKNIEAAERTAKEFGFERATDDNDSVLNDPDINTIFSCVPTKFHLEIVKKATDLRKAVFLEKPFAISIEQAEEVHKLLSESSAPHQVGFVLRYAPTYKAMQKLLEKQAAESPLRHVSLRDDQQFPISGIHHFTDWRSKVDLAGAGVLIEHGIHDLDMFEVMFGKMKRISATQKNFHEYEGIEDFFDIRIEFESGVTASMIQIWHDIPAHTSVRSFEIFYNKSLVTSTDYFMHDISVRDQEAEKMYERNDLFAMLADDPMYKDISHREDLLFMSDIYAIQDYWFLRNLIEGKQMMPTIDDGLRAFKLAHACYDSAKQDGAWVNV